MKYSILAVVSAACLFSASALHAQTTNTTTTRNTTTRATISKGRTFTVPRRPAPVVTTLAPRTDGVIPRAIRSGEPLQMINPFAPAAYGSGEENARHEPNDPYARPQGIKLATVEF